jgi:hypothetical protein
MTRPTLDQFTRAYLKCALWTSDPYAHISGEWSEHDDWTIDNIDDASIARAVDVCADFQTANRADLDELNDTFHIDDARHGHDFWLTRNRHGAGFWDRGYELLNKDIARRLTDNAHAYGSADVFGPETNDNGSSSDAQLSAWNKRIIIED